MDTRNESSENLRNKCAACYRQYNKIEHLVEHMKTSCHSNHEPVCGVCRKHFRSFESLREHVIGPLPKAECERVFKERGCDLCLAVLNTRYALHPHRERCQFSRRNNVHRLMSNLSIQDELKIDNSRRKVVSLAWKKVGGGSDGSLDLCARVCLVDDRENIIFQTYVKPHLHVTNYRYDTTGIRPEFLRDAMPLRQVQRKIQDYLCNGEPIWQIHSRGGGKARILVGHGLDYDLKCLELEYPDMLIRDLAKYPPLMKTSKLSNSMKHLTKAYLGYDIQTGVQDPYEDCVAAMRLYTRMRSQAHKAEAYSTASELQVRNNFATRRQSELERMSPEKMLEISRCDYYCWCLDSK